MALTLGVLSIIAFMIVGKYSKGTANDLADVGAKISKYGKYSLANLGYASVECANKRMVFENF